MKIFKKIIVGMLALQSCNQIALHPPRKLSIGTVTAKMNGSEWTSIYKNAYQVIQGGRQTMFPCIEASLYANFELYSPEGFLRQQLLFSKIPEHTGNYTIVNSSPRNCSDRDSVYCSLLTFIDDGCIAESAYEVMANESNFIKVDRYDEETGEIKGSFEMVLVKTNPLYASNLPDTLHFSEGHFVTKVIIGRHTQ